MSLIADTSLIALRMDKGLSTRRAAERIGISRQTLLNAERGLPLHVGTMKKIADFYDVRVTEIWPVVNAGAAV